MGGRWRRRVDDDDDGYDNDDYDNEGEDEDVCEENDDGNDDDKDEDDGEDDKEDRDKGGDDDGKDNDADEDDWAVCCRVWEFCVPLVSLVVSGSCSLEWGALNATRSSRAVPGTLNCNNGISKTV